MNCGRWSENVDVTLPGSVSSKDVPFEKISSINVDALEILVGKNIRGNKKLELRVSIKLFVESGISYFEKSILKSPRRKIRLDDSFCNFSNKGEIKSFAKSLIENVGYLYIQPTITLVDFEHIISINVDSIFGVNHRVLGHSLVDKKVFYLYKEVSHQLTIQLWYLQSSN